MVYEFILCINEGRFPNTTILNAVNQLAPSIPIIQVSLDSNAAPAVEIPNESTPENISSERTHSEKWAMATDIGQRMGVVKLPVGERRRLCSNLVRGLKCLADSDINAPSYFAALELLGAISDSEVQIMDQGKYPIHPLTRQLIAQPLTELSPATGLQCLAIGSKLFINTWRNTSQVSSAFSHGVEQLYTSKRPEWKVLRGGELTNPAYVKETIDKSTSVTVNQFAKELYVFLSTGLPKANSIKVVDAVEQKKEIDKETTPKNSDKSQKAAKQEADDITPDFDLFNKQLDRDLHPDLVDGNRLPLQWNRPTVLECKATTGRLNQALFNKEKDPDSMRRRYHAACRYLSLFCGVSLKSTQRLPLARRSGSGRGSMHLHIYGGFIRRDQLCSVLRTMQPRFRGRWRRTFLPEEVVQVLVEMFDLHPECKTVGELMLAFGLDHETCQHYLNDGWPSSHRPEDARFAHGLRVILLDLGVHPEVVGQFTGDDMTTPPSDHSYLALLQSQLFDALDKFCSWAGLTPPKRPNKDSRIGSPKYTSSTRMGLLMKALNSRIHSARNKVTSRSCIEDVIAFHNEYVPAVVLQIIWGIGGRGNLIGKLSFERIFSSSDLMIISDRRVDRYTRARVIPSTPQLTETRQNYIEHLQSISDRLAKDQPECSKYVSNSVTGQLPHICAFQIFEKFDGGWKIRDIKRSDLVSLMKKLGMEIGIELTADDLNISRHYWYTALVEANVVQVAIEAFLGHHIPNSEPFAFGSGISVRQVTDYLMPILVTMHDEIGLKPLQGLGRTAERYKKLPIIPIPKHLRALPNLLLKTKLNAQDFEIREAPFIDADPPVDSKTLVSHSYMNELKAEFLKSGNVKRYPLGSLLFCLVAFDLVLSPVELKALFISALIDGPKRVANIVALEATEDDLPVAQRLLQSYTIDACGMARSKKFDDAEMAFEIACTELKSVLLSLSPEWVEKPGVNSMQRLARIASHWAAIEIAQGDLYGVFHKAPFFPIEDVARIHFAQPCISISSGQESIRRGGRPDRGFEPILEIIRKYANRDLVLGESDTRSRDCIEELRKGKDSGSFVTDFADIALIEILSEDLSKEATYKQLKATVLPSYAAKYCVFFEYARKEGSLEHDAEAWIEIFEEMGVKDDVSTSDHVRWSLLHIAHFLNSRGYWAPPVLLEEKARKPARPPRSPVYTTLSEVEKAATRVDQEMENKGGTYTFSGSRAKLQRSCPTRAAEIRYSRPRDLDLDAQVIHIAPSGHNHIKNDASIGSIHIPQPLCEELKSIVNRRQQISVGTHTLLFCDAHLEDTYRAYDIASDAITSSIAITTGKSKFREHDFRVSAVTDLGFPIESAIHALAKGADIHSNNKALTADALKKEHTRYAWAGRNARHKSVLTTLRYYTMSGPIAIKCRLDGIHRNLQTSGAYQAAVLGSNSQAIFAANHRLRAKSSNSILSQFEKSRIEYLESIPTPNLVGPTNMVEPPAQVKVPGNITSKLIKVSLMNAMGLKLEAAADAMQISMLLAQQFDSDLRALSKVAHIKLDQKDEVPVLTSVLTGKKLLSENLISGLASWIVSQSGSFKDLTDILISALDRSGSRMTFNNTDSILRILLFLSGFSRLGIELHFRAGAGVFLSSYPGLVTALEKSKVLVYPGNGAEKVLGSLSFRISALDSTQFLNADLTRKAASSEKVSPRSIGRGGRLAIRSMLIGLLIHN